MLFVDQDDDDDNDMEDYEPKHCIILGKQDNFEYWFKCFKCKS